jgi:hypothetical protein
LVHTYYCHFHLSIKQYLKFRFTFKPKFNSLLNIDRTGVYIDMGTSEPGLPRGPVV